MADLAELITEAKRLTLGPNDVLWVSTPAAMHPEEQEQVAKALSAALPGVRCVVASDELEPTVVADERVCQQGEKLSGPICGGAPTARLANGGEPA